MTAACGCGMSKSGSKWLNSRSPRHDRMRFVGWLREANHRSPGVGLSGNPSHRVPLVRPMQPQQVFLLSPASCSGRRAALLFNERAQFFLARQLRTPAGAPLGEVFSFLSGLYFRGKLTYARAFGQLIGPETGIAVITAGRGLVHPDT